MEETVDKGMDMKRVIQKRRATIEKNRLAARLNFLAMDDPVYKGIDLKRAIQKKRATEQNRRARRNLLAMDDPVYKGPVWNEAIEESREIGRIFATGYDTKGCREHVTRELKKLYSSCGEITDVYIHTAPHDTLWRSAIVYFVGEGAVDKALQLNGTDMGGWTVSAKDYPFPEADKHSAEVEVEGYDTSLTKTDIRCALDQFFSSCGKIEEVMMYKSFSQVLLVGENVAEKSTKLSGSYMGGRKVVVRLISLPPKYTVNPRGHKGCGYW